MITFLQTPHSHVKFPFPFFCHHCYFLPVPSLHNSLILKPDTISSLSKDGKNIKCKNIKLLSLDKKKYLTKHLLRISSSQPQWASVNFRSPRFQTAGTSWQQAASLTKHSLTLAKKCFSKLSMTQNLLSRINLPTGNTAHINQFHLLSGTEGMRAKKLVWKYVYILQWRCSTTQKWAGQCGQDRW